MATYNYDNSTRTFTAVFTAAENRVAKQALNDVPGAIGNELDAWLSRQALIYGARDKDVIREALKSATPAQLDAVKTALGI